MGRPIYPYEIADPDVRWLVSNFQEQNPHYRVIETAYSPIIFIRVGEKESEIIGDSSNCPHFSKSGKDL